MSGIYMILVFLAVLAALNKYKEVADAYAGSDAALYARYRQAATFMALGAPKSAAEVYQQVIAQGGTSVYVQMAKLGLAEAQARNGLKVIALVPLYDVVREVATDLQPVGDPFVVTLGRHADTVQLYRETRQRGGVDVVFLDAPDAFRRKGIYGEGGYDYGDNHIRFGFFSRAALAAADRLVPGPLLIHAHDWHTGLLPVFARTDPVFPARLRSVPLVVSAHNAGYQGWFPGHLIADLAVPAHAKIGRAHV